MDFVVERERRTEIFDTCDVLVVGAGPAGVTAAVAAAKNTSGKVVLIERFPYLGGMATGGQVIAIPFLSDGKDQLVTGIMDEWIDRLRVRKDGCFGPLKSETGSTDEAVLNKYRKYGLFGRREVRYGVNCDPELLKVVLAQMVSDYGITVYCNVLFCAAIAEGDSVKGVIFESKEGRKAILAKLVIDCTGDGDVFASAGAAYETSSFSTSRTANTALVFRVGGVDYEKFADANAMPPGDPHSPAQKMAALGEELGFRFTPFASNRNDIIWVNNWIPKNCMDVRGLTETAFIIFNSAERIVEYFRSNFTGMENAYLLDFASQVGTRGSRRLKGMERFTMDHVARRTGRDDLIAIVPTLGGMEDYPRMEMPYGIIVPEKVDGLLVAGRCFSSEEKANEAASWIPYCVVLGEAAGTAAALCLEEDIQPRQLSVRKLQTRLASQGALVQ